MRRKFRKAQDHTLYLRREYVDAADDEHVVAAAHDTVHAHQRTPARTFLIVQRRQVVRPVAQQRHRLLGQVRETQFAHLALRQRFPRRRVHNLRIIIVFVQVQTVLAFTLEAHARTRHLAQSVHVIRLDAERLLQFLTHVLRPRLRAENSDTQLEFLARKRTLLDRLAQIHRIRRRTAQNRRTEVMHQRDLLLRVARRHRDHRRPDLLTRIVRSQTARKQSVAVRNLRHVVFRRSVRYQSARKTLLPTVQVTLRRQRNNRLARRSRRSMDPHHVTHRGGTQTERIMVPQVYLVRKRQPDNVIDVSYVIRRNAQLLESLRVKWRVLIHIGRHLSQPFTLQRPHLVAAHALYAFVPEHLSVECFLFCGMFFLLCGMFLLCSIISLLKTVRFISRICFKIFLNGFCLSSCRE